VSRPNDFRLQHGTVIDHLPVGTAVRALELLGIPDAAGRPGGGPVTVGINVPSRRYGRKDIVRVEGLELRKQELDRLALLGRGVTVSIVGNGEVTGKIVLEVPRRLNGILRCPNPTCITNHERVATSFDRMGDFPYRFKCVYCERVTGAARA
jgi:aspartate carbamoyltransferase regulatory subunit